MDEPQIETQITDRTTELLEIEDRWGAHNYHPLDVVVERAAGPWVYAVDGKRYLDCLSAYSAVNQGHCNPRILKALIEQLKKIYPTLLRSLLKITKILL